MAAPIPPVPDMGRCKKLTDLIVSSAEASGFTAVELAVVVSTLHEMAIKGLMGEDAQRAAEMMGHCMKVSAS